MAARIFPNLEGAWAFTRTTLSASREKMSVLGKARFTRKDPSTLHYEEKGELTTSEGKTAQVSRSYLYKFEEGKMALYFDENPPRLFYTLSFKDDKSATGSHLCGQDVYSATHRFFSQEIFHLEYLVVGPKKNDQIKTIYTKERV